MRIFKEYSQSRGFLLPHSPGEFVAENYEARIINEVVDTIDLSAVFAEYEDGEDVCLFRHGRLGAHCL
jgi:hypothetical protein